MADPTLVDRLLALRNLQGIPREELAWLIAHGRLELHQAGAVVAPKGQPVEKLWIILSGQVAVRVDRGAGSRRVIEWRAGEISGMLPFSRMTGPPGDNYTEQTTELLTIADTHFAEMIHRCPMFTAQTVHLMLDRARRFNASDLHDEKMISLGKLAAGLAHELNNPASATIRSAKILRASLDEADVAARTLGAADLPDDLLKTIDQVHSACLVSPVHSMLSPVQQANREDEIADWLVRHQMDPDHAAALADTAVTIDALETLGSATSGQTLNAAIHWIVVGCTTQALAVDIEQAATRIYELVDAVKKFSYMDNLAGPESVDVETGLRDTIRIVASKAKLKGATITVDLDKNLPQVQATGGELNQVWLNLIDNALDAVHESGHIDIRARTEGNRVVVRITDDGPGIPPDVMPLIFDPFFTTKPPGQGTGLGLEITRRLLRRYRGEISAQSRAGRTEFRVDLLVNQPAARAGDKPNGH